MQHIKEIARQSVAYWHHANSWVLPVAVIVVVIILERLLHWTFIWRVKIAGSRQHIWLYAFLRALHVPARVLVGLLGLVLLKRHYLPNGRVPDLDYFYIPITHIVAVVMIAWFFLRLVDNLKDSYENFHSHLDYTLINALMKLSWASVLVLAALAIMAILGISPGGLLAFGGAAGIAVGFAAQTLIANLFGGLTIFISRIFRITETIIIPGSPVEGVVQNIGWRSTLVMGWDGLAYYIPNSHFNSSTVINYSRMGHRSMSEYLLLRYRDIDNVKETVKQSNKWLENNKDLSYALIRFDGFGEEALKLLLYAQTPLTDYKAFMEFKEEILLQLGDFARKHGCELIMPVSNLYMREWPAGSGISPGPRHSSGDSSADNTASTQQGE